MTPGSPTSGNRDSRGKWAKLAFATGAVSAWSIYDMATATEAPSPLLNALQFFILACALIALAGCLWKLATVK